MSDIGVDALAAGLAGVSLGPPTAKGPHESLVAMLRLGGLRRNPVCGDGNCAYYAACGSLDERWLVSRGISRLESAGHSQADVRLQHTVRGLVVDWLQREENAEHRFVGCSEKELEWDEAGQRWKPIPPPPASAVAAHRRDGTYADTPILRALAEVLRCVIVSLDSSRLFDRVPVFTCGQRQTLKLKSWRTIAPLLARGESLATDLPTIVIVNNGLLGPGSHFDATARDPSSCQTAVHR
jgi:hypothetical protein